MTTKDSLFAYSAEGEFRYFFANKPSITFDALV